MTELAPFLSTRAQRGYIGTVLVEAIIVLTMIAIIFGLVQSNVDTNRSTLRTLPAYFALFAFAEFFHLILALDALRLRNIIQIVGIQIFHLGLIIFSALQIQQTKQAIYQAGDCGDYDCTGPHSLWNLVEAFQLVVPIVLGVSWFILQTFAWQLFAEFGWAVFRIVGADPRMKRMFRWYQIQVVLLKFDYFAFTGLTMQLLIIVLQHDKAEYGLTIAAIPVVLILLIICGIAVAREIKFLMILGLVLQAAAEAYFIFKFVRLFLPETRHQYDTSRKTLGVFIIAAFLLMLATFIVGVVCFFDFGKGLRQGKIREPSSLPRLSGVFQDKRESKAFPPSPAGTPMFERGESYYSGGHQLQERMSIE